MKLRLTIIILIAAGGLASAVDWTSPGTAITTSAERDGLTVVSVTDAANREFEVAYDPAALTGGQIREVVALKDLLHGWDGLVVGRLSFTVTPGQVEALVVPQRVWYEGADLSFSVPGGMRFFAGDPVTYSFRMVQDELFMLMDGRLLSEVELLRKMAAALRDPAAFVRERTTDYLVARLDQVNQNMDRYAAQLLDVQDTVTVQARTDQELTQQVAALGGDTGSMQASFNVAIQAALQERDQLRVRVTDLESALDRQQAGLQAEVQRLQGDLQRQAQQQTDALNALEVAHLDLVASYQELSTSHGQVTHRP